MLMFMMMPLSTASAQSVVPVNNPGVYIAETSTNAHDPLDPSTNYETLGGSLIQEVYEGLLRYDGNSLTSYAPSLAYTNYTISPDGTNYTFYLRSDVNFTDGSPFNAYIMQYSIERAIIMNDPSSGEWITQSVIKGGSYINSLADENVTQANIFLANMSVMAESDTVLSIALPNASSAFIPAMIFPSADAVSPSDIIANEPSNYKTDPTDNVYGMVNLQNMFPQLTPTQITTKLGLPAGHNMADSGIVPESAHDGPSAYNWDPTKEPGTGPYMMKSDVPGVATTLVKNNNWWNKANFNPNSPDTVQLKQVSETSTRILDLKNGQAESVYIPNSNLGEVMNVSTHIPSINNVNVYTYPSLTEDFLGFNQNDSLESSQVLQNKWSTDNQYNESFIKANHVVQYSWNNATGQEQLASPNNPFTSLL